MKHKIIGICSNNLEIAEKFSDLLAVSLGDSWQQRAYGDAPVKWSAEATGMTIETMNENLNAYLPKQWSYIREERFVEDGNVERRPVTYHQSPKNIIYKLKSLMRDIHSNFWVNALFNDVTPESKWIIEDVIYPNEAERILLNGGVIVKLNSPVISQKTFVPDSMIDMIIQVRNIDNAVIKVLQKYKDDDTN